MATVRCSTFTAPGAHSLRRPCPRTVVAGASRVAEPVSIPVKSADGADNGTASIALKVADPSTARHVVHRSLLTAHASRRQGSANTKTRSEVRGGGKKPLQQKGSGKARMGSLRTPLKPGGGVTFGPKPKDWNINMNKKEKALAMSTALQSAAADMIVLDTVPSIEGRKTKSLVSMFKNMGVDVMDTKTLLITNEQNEDVQVAGKNISRLEINEANCIRLTDVLGSEKIVVEKEALQFINSKFQ